MTEPEYEKNILKLILELKEKHISSTDFYSRARKLGRKFDTFGYRGYMPLSDFKDQELGWAKYFIEEMDYYGIDAVLKNHFDYFKFYEERKSRIIEK